MVFVTTNDSNQQDCHSFGDTVGGGGGQEEEKKEVRGDGEQSLGSKERQVQSQVSSPPWDHSLSKPQLTMPYG